MSSKIVVRDVEPFHQFEMGLSLEPGIHPVRGQNGQGKSFLLEHALGRASGNKEVTLMPRAGHKVGMIEITDGDNTMTIRVGQKVTVSGILPFRLERKLGDALARLVKPKADKDETRALERVKALCEIAGIEPTPDRLDTLAGCHVDVTLKFGATIADGARKVRDVLFDLKNDAKSDKDTAAGARETLDMEIGKLVTPEPVPESIPVAAARTVCNEVMRNAAVLRNGADARKREEARLEQIRANRGERPNPSKMDKHIQTHQLGIQNLEQAIRDLETQLARKREELISERGNLHICMEQKQATERAAEQWDREESLLSTPIDLPTEAEALKAEQMAQKASDVLDEARDYANYLEAVERHDTTSARLKAARERALEQEMSATKDEARYTAAAAKVWDNLADMLANAGLDDFLMHEGILSVRMEDDRIRPYDDIGLSFGQRIHFAFRAVMRRLSETGEPGKTALLLPEGFWQALDEDHQQAAQTEALIAGIAVYAEVPGGGEGIWVEDFAA